jgi:hypothetical protein
VKKSGGLQTSGFLKAGNSARLNSYGPLVTGSFIPDYQFRLHPRVIRRWCASLDGVCKGDCSRRQLGRLLG